MAALCSRSQFNVSNAVTLTNSYAVLMIKYDADNFFVVRWPGISNPYKINNDNVKVGNRLITTISAATLNDMSKAYQSYNKERTCAIQF